MADLQLVIKTAGFDQADAALKGLANSAGGLGGIAGGIAKAGLLGLAAAGGVLATGVGVGIKAAGDLQQAVANISTIKPDIDTSAVFNSLNEMQTRVPQSAAQLGDSLYNIFSSIDVSTEGGIQLVEKFSKGAVGAGTDAETFGTAVLGVMNAYKLSVADADHISDVFFNTVNAGVVTGQELASSLGPVTQAAKAAGVNIDELGGLIAGVTKEGGPAAQNINNLNNFLQKVTTKDAVKAMKDLGVAAVDQTGHFRPVTDILTDLSGRLGKMTEAERNNAIQSIFPDAQARQGALTLISQLDFVKGAIETNKTEAGSAASAFEKMNATFNSQVKILGNTLTSILTTVGAEILPIITPLISAFAAQLPGAFQAARAALTPVVAGFLALSVAGTPLIQFLQDLWGTVQQVFAHDWSPDTSINPVINVLGQLASFVRDVIIPNLQQLGQVVQSALNGDFASAFAGMGAIIQRTAAAVGPYLLQLGQQFVAWIGPQIPPMLAKLQELAAALVAWIGEQAPVWGAQLLAWGQAFVAWVGPMIPPALAALGEAAAAFGAWIAQQAPVWLAQLAAWGQAFVDWVAPMIPPALAALANFAADILTWITEASMNFAAQLAIWGIQFIAWVARDVLPNLPGALANILSAISSWISGSGPQVASEASSIGANLMDGIRSGIMARVEAIAATAAAAIQRVIQAARDAAGISSPSKEMMVLGRFMADGLGLGIQQDSFKAVGSMKDLTTAIVNLAKDQLSLAQPAADALGRALQRLGTEGGITQGTLARLKSEVGGLQVALGTAAAQGDKLAALQQKLSDAQLWAKPQDLAYQQKFNELDKERIPIEQQLLPLTIKRREAEEQLRIAQENLRKAQDTKGTADDKAAEQQVETAQKALDAINDQAKPLEDQLQTIRDREQALRLEEQAWAANQKTSELAQQQDITFEQQLQRVFQAQIEDHQKAIDKIHEQTDAVNELRKAYDKLPGGGGDQKKADTGDSSPVVVGGDTPSFDQGGIVPGPLGWPRLILAHGGEKVLTPEQQRSGGVTYAPVFQANSDEDLVRKWDRWQRRQETLMRFGY